VFGCQFQELVLKIKSLSYAKEVILLVTIWRKLNIIILKYNYKEIPDTEEKKKL